MQATMVLRSLLLLVAVRTSSAYVVPRTHVKKSLHNVAAPPSPWMHSAANVEHLRRRDHQPNWNIHAGKAGAVGLAAVAVIAAAGTSRSSDFKKSPSMRAVPPTADSDFRKIERVTVALARLGAIASVLMHLHNGDSESSSYFLNLCVALLARPRRSHRA
mmetsp:Transcript_34151/g.106573  ORF Transcript_34151/g.106573 Transcript_34151/m.106573 type:complete len:160 (-) Transcript_34151:87-566(-)